MAKIVTDRPSDFVDYLTSPGLPINNMDIPLKQYLCSVPSFGGNDEAALVIGLVNRKVFMDDATQTKISSQTTSIGRMTTGQGYPNDIMLFMTHIADNIDKVRALPELKNKSYIRDPNLSTEDILNKMVAQKVFGLDCIGFISQYLVYTGIWDAYKTYYPKDYTREFTPIRTLSEIERLCLVIWDNYHIGIINNVQSLDTNSGLCVVDICQSSSLKTGATGPQTNIGVSLRKSSSASYLGHQKFDIVGRGTPAMPVSSPVYICKMPDLVWQVDM